MFLFLLGGEFPQLCFFVGPISGFIVIQRSDFEFSRVWILIFESLNMFCAQAEMRVRGRVARPSRLSFPIAYVINRSAAGKQNDNSETWHSETRIKQKYEQTEHL